MRISLSAFKFHLQFIKPFDTGKKIIDGRDGLILLLTDESGHTGISEITLLAGFTKGNPEQITEELGRLNEYLKKNAIPGNIPELTIYTKTMTDKLNISSQLSFALDSALVSVIEKRESIPLYELFSYSGITYISPPEIRINALVVPESDIESTYNSILTYVSKGFDTIKIKLGRIKRERERELLKMVAIKLGDNIRIRTDSNMKMNFDEAVEFFRIIDPGRVEYAEDPFPDLERIPEFYSKTGIKTGIEVNESYNFLGELADNQGVGAIVAKPAKIGSLRNLEAIFKYCYKKNIPLILSSLFESGLGIINIAKISAIFDYKMSAMGLDTLKYLKEDILKFPIIFQDGSIAPYNLNLDDNFSDIFYEKKLERVL